jgi:hypothetical protein
MRNECNIVLFAFVFMLSFSCTNAPKQKNVLDNGFFQNPVLGGDYPDPSVVRVGSDYYLTHSSFEYYPGLLVWHSTEYGKGSSGAWMLPAITTMFFMVFLV